MVTVTDTFQGANGTGLSAHNAAFAAVDGAGAFSISDNKLRCDDWTDVCSRYSGSGIGSNQYAEATLGTPEQFRYMGPAVRISDTEPTYYFVKVHTTNIALARMDNGSETGLGDSTQAFSGGEVIRLEANGTTIRVLVDDVEVISATDATIGDGDPGVHGNGGFASTRLDDWEAGDLAGPDVTPPTISNVAEGSITSSGATITWDTDEDATTRVLWGTTPANRTQNQFSTSGLRQSHSQALIGLPSGTTIYYQVLSEDAAGNPATHDGEFDTSSGGPTTIGTVTESRITSCTARLEFTTGAIRSPQVEYGYQDGNYTENTGSLDAGTSHDVRLRGMPQGRTVYYRVTADGAAPVTGDFQLTAWPSSIKLAVNLSELTHTALSKDHQKFATPWRKNNYDFWVIGNGAGQLPVDADGWPTTIPAEGVITGTNQSLPGSVVGYPLGDYRFEWQGTGAIQAFVGGEVIETGANHLVLRVTARTQDGIQYRILTTGTGGNHLRGLKIIEPGQVGSQVHHSDRLGRYAQPYQGGYRFMDLHDTNEKSDRPPAVSWAGTDALNAGNTDEDRYTYHHAAAYGGFPYARTVALCNDTNRAGWWCVPHTFDDASVRLMARYLRDNLREGVKCRIEHSNETWNGTFDQGAYCAAQGAARSYAGGSFEQQARYHGARTVEIADIFREEWPASRHGDLEFVLGAWAGVSGYVSDALDQIGPAGHAKLKAIAIGNYIGEYLGTSGYVATTKTYTNDQLHEECRRHLYDTGTIGSGGNEVSGVIKRIRDNKAEADAAGLELWAYEGALHLVGVAGNENDQVLTDLFVAYNRSGLAGDVEAEMYDVWRQEGGGLFARFNSEGPFLKWGSWGSQERDDDPNAKQIVSESLAAGPTGTPGRAWNRFEFGSTFKF